MGYSEFELDIPEVMRVELPRHFDNLTADPLTAENIAALPENAQGAYLLELKGAVVYVGKTDARAGFRLRLRRHMNNLRHRTGLDPENVGFKAVRVFVFSNFDLEDMLIAHYRPTWNNSGFGSNDPGARRDEQEASKFDTWYPVDIDRPADFLEPGERDVLQILKAMKRELPYLLRYDTAGRHWSRGHPDFEGVSIDVPDPRPTTREALRLIVGALPSGWSATLMFNRVLLYKNSRQNAGQREVIAKPAP